MIIFITLLKIKTDFQLGVNLASGTEENYQKAQRTDKGYTLAEYISNMVAFNKQYKGKFIFEVTIINDYNDDDESIHKIKNIIAGRDSYDFVEDTSGVYLRTQTLSDLTSFHSDHGLTPLQIRPSNLEDVFLKLTGKELSVDA